MSSPDTFGRSPQQPDPFQSSADDLDPPAAQVDPQWQARCERWQTGEKPHVGRHNQQIPPGDWLIWLILAGRGFGKTRTGAEAVSRWALNGPGIRIALVGQTFTDARDTMVEGKAGLLNCLPDSALRGGTRETAWNRSLGELFFANGAKAKIFSSEKPGQLRGPEHDKAWADEPAKFHDARLGDALDTTWNNLMLGLRGMDGRPQAIVTGTPTAGLLIRQLVKHPAAHVTRGSTYDNLANLAPSFRAEILSRYEGTRIGRQELHGEILEDVEGALWTLTVLDDLRVPVAPVDLVKIVVAVDPAGGTKESNDETGIVVAAKGADGHGYTIADRSGRYTPNGWASKAIAAYDEFSADRIVAEANYGGDMVANTLRQAGFKGHVEIVHASRGKRQRAEPVAALYEQGRWHHCGPFPKLEDQMVTWLADSGDSPDRMDALVWAATDLFIGSMVGQTWAAAWQQLAAEEAARQPAPPTADLPARSLGRLSDLTRR